jgi:hypothetical protein
MGFDVRVTGEQRVGGGHDEQRQQRAERHAADDHPADLRARFGARAGGERERHGAQHHRAGGHQDGPQAQRRRIDHRVDQLLALGAKLIGELDDQDAVLGDEPDQRNQSHLAVDVERSSGEPERDQRTGHRQRHRQHDDERIDEAFELRRQHKIDEREREHERQVDFAPRRTEFARLAIEVGLRGIRQRARPRPRSSPSALRRSHSLARAWR